MLDLFVERQVSHQVHFCDATTAGGVPCNFPFRYSGKKRLGLLRMTDVRVRLEKIVRIPQAQYTTQQFDVMFFYANASSSCKIAQSLQAQSYVMQDMQ